MGNWALIWRLVGEHGVDVVTSSCADLMLSAPLGKRILGICPQKGGHLLVLWSGNSRLWTGLTNSNVFSICLIAHRICDNMLSSDCAGCKGGRVQSFSYANTALLGLPLSQTRGISEAVLTLRLQLSLFKTEWVQSGVSSHWVRRWWSQCITAWRHMYFPEFF